MRDYSEIIETAERITNSAEKFNRITEIISAVALDHNLTRLQCKQWLEILIKKLTP